MRIMLSTDIVRKTEATYGAGFYKDPELRAQAEAAMLAEIEAGTRSKYHSSGRPSSSSERKLCRVRSTTGHRNDANY